MVLAAPELIWQKKILSLFFDTKKQRHPRQIAFLPDTFVKIAWVSVTGNGVTKVAQVEMVVVRWEGDAAGCITP